MTTTDPVDEPPAEPEDGPPSPDTPDASSAHSDTADVLPGRPPGSRYVPAVLSALLPGLGQLRLGRRRQALAFGLPVVALVVIAVAYVVGQGPARAATSMLAVEALWGLIAIQVALLAWRLAASGATIVERRFGPLGRRDILPVALLVVAIAAPQAWALAATNALRVAADRIFLDDGPGGGAWVPPTPTPGPSPSGATPSPSASPEPTATPAVPRVNLLVIGVDAGVGRRTFLTDTMIVASLDPVAGTVSLLSIPRDMVDVPLPDGTVFSGKINSLVSWARHHPGQFPGSDGQGYDVLMGAIGTLLEIDIDLYAQVSLGGFVRVVDRLGGIDVNVARAFCDPGYREYGFPNGFSIKAGPHHLNGQAALAYARVRRASGESDFTRAARQQELLSGIRDAIVRGRFLGDPIGLLDALGRTITTNVPRSMLPDLAAWAAEVDRGATFRAVISHPLVQSDFDHRGSIQVPDVPAIRAFTATLFGPAGALPDPATKAPDPLPGKPTTFGVGSCTPAPTPTPAPTATPVPSDSAEPSLEPSPSVDPSAAPTPTFGLEPSPSSAP